MRIPLARYGLREILLGTLLCAALGALAWWLRPPLVVLPAAAWIFLLSFFRDPERPCRAQPGELLSPADGTVADITEVDGRGHIQGPALRVGVFMSVLNCHVNRAPVAGVVESTKHTPGRFLDARDERAPTANEQNLIVLRTDSAEVPVLINQIAGKVARRIVCAVGTGQRLAQGERLGMIKFGSRLELIVPQSCRPEVRVQVGQKVKAGRDVLVALAPHATPPPQPD